MTGLGIGDLTQSFMQRHRHAALKQEMSRLEVELTTGRRADVRQVLPGNHSHLAGLERRIGLLTSYASANREAGHIAGAMQAALGQVAEVADGLSLGLITSGDASSGISTAKASAQASSSLKRLVATLNGSFAGRSLFGGAATDRRPLVSSDALRDGLKAAITGITDPVALAATARTWFDAPSGFAAIAYRGATDAPASIALSFNETVTLDLRATTPELRDILRQTTLAALANDPALALGPSQQSQLLRHLGEEMLGGSANLTKLRADLGNKEARIEQLSAQSAFEITSLQMAQGALMNVDPYDAATRLEEVQFQLQSLYSMTVRMSKLSLVNFL